MTIETGRRESEFHFALGFGKNNQILIKCWQLFDKILTSDDIWGAPGQRQGQIFTQFPQQQKPWCIGARNLNATFFMKKKTIKIFWEWLGRFLVNISIDVEIGPKTLSHHPHLHHHSISAGNIGICQKFQLYLPQPRSARADNGRYISGSDKTRSSRAPEKARHARSCWWFN